MIAWLKGKKTYVIALVMIVFAFTGYVLGKLDTQAAIEVVLQAAAFAGIRSALSTRGI